MADKQFLSILGFYNYDNSIFDNMQVPEGVDKSLVIDNILLDNAQLSLIYTDYDFMKYIIGIWSRSELDIWTKLNNAFNEEYNPLWNVDENTTETRTIEREGAGSSTNTTIVDRDSSSVEDGSTDTTNSIKGFNSDTWAEHDKSVTNNDNTITNTDDITTTDTGNTTDSESVTDTFTRVRGGNIGVTMSQQLLEAELNTRPKMNIYKYISTSFKKRFCSMIY